MAISESSDNQSEIDNPVDDNDDNEDLTPGLTTPNIDTPGVVSSIDSEGVFDFIFLKFSFPEFQVNFDRNLKIFVKQQKSREHMPRESIMAMIQLLWLTQK